MKHSSYDPLQSLFLKFFTVQTPVCLMKYKVPCLDKNEKAMHGTDVDPLHMYDSCLVWCIFGTPINWIRALPNTLAYYWEAISHNGLCCPALIQREELSPTQICQCFVDTHGRPASLRTETRMPWWGDRWESGRGIRKRGGSWHYIQNVK